MISMFFRLFRTRVKVLSKQKSMLFWTLAFPIVLATFFFLAFSNLTSSETFVAPKIGMVAQEHNPFVTYLEALKEGEPPLFELTIGSEEELRAKLENNDIAGYYRSNPDLEMVVKKNGFEQTFLHYILEQYNQNKAIIERISTTHPEALETDVLATLRQETNYFAEQNANNTDITVIYFYTLIGMVCMYAGFFGIYAVNESEANLSTRGARMNISPTHKLKSLCVSLLAGWLFQVVELLILLAYLVFVLHIDFGNNSGYLLLIMFVGSLAGLATGTLFGSLSKHSADTKISVFVTFCLVLSFFAGMMVVDIKYIIATNFPILNQINPVSLITDALYSLYYYPTLDRYFSNFFLLLVFSGIMILLSYLCLRRKKYDSI